jgi:hypothetical protein
MSLSALTCAVLAATGGAPIRCQVGLELALPQGRCRPCDCCFSLRGPMRHGGARRDRTDDLMLAKHALSQLSYGPDPERPELVGPDRFELSTSRLSSARSNQLSYGPAHAPQGRSTQAMRHLRTRSHRPRIKRARRIHTRANAHNVDRGEEKRRRRPWDLPVNALARESRRIASYCLSRALGLPKQARKGASLERR